ncbi:MAG: hypothetical protein KGZ42_06745 [Melioribacter sp.]|nr:hypothetical protein [Melioribacter sp.]
MNNIYKYGFYIFALCSLIFFNTWNISRIKFKDTEKIQFNKTERRLKSLHKSNIILYRKVHEIYGYEITTGEKNKILSKDASYLIVLLSDFDCSKCQENELKNLFSIKERLMSFGIKILCITKKEKVNRIVVQMRSMNINLPLFYISDDNFLELSFDIEYPQIELINKGIIVSAFLPVKQDYEFSSVYYRELIGKLIDKYL